MSAVVALPTAASAPVVQPTHGRRSRSVASLHAYRRRTEQVKQERRQLLLRVLRELHEAAVDGEIDGVLVVVQMSADKEDERVLAAGCYQSSDERIVQGLHHALDILDSLEAEDPQ